MQNRKFLWSAIAFVGAGAALFSWYAVAPAGVGNSLDIVRGTATQAWDNVLYGSGAPSDQTEITINESSSSDEVGDATNDQGAPSSSSGVAALLPAPLPLPEDNSADSGASVTGPAETSLPSGASSSPADAGTINAPVSISPATSSCSFVFPSAPNPSSTFMPQLSRQIIFNEIAWMGSSGASNGEWMEIKNETGGDIDLSGWEIVNATGKIKIPFTDGDHIPAGGLLLLARTNAVLGDNATPQKNYSGDLRNTGDDLALVDASCDLSDFLEASSTGWPAGNNTTKQTMERDADGAGWHTSVVPGGTPGQENSVPPPPAMYKATVSFEGSGSATITSDPSGMVCGVECVGSYASGTKLTLAITPASSTIFDGWLGACYGKASCVLTLTGDVSVTVQIHSALALSGSAMSPSNTVDDTTAVATSTVDTPASSTASTTVAISSSDQSVDQSTNGAPSTPGHILIAAIQIAGATAGDDLIKLYNPTASAVDMSGWKLRKKSQSGADYSVREFPSGTTIAPQQYFVWASSADGFAASVNADTSSTQTLAADNSVALMDSSGAIVDAVAWGTGTGQYGEGPPYPTDPAANQMLVRQSANGVMIDTDNNANDFVLQ